MGLPSVTVLRRTDVADAAGVPWPSVLGCV
jgi:hypothetical protein